MILSEPLLAQELSDAVDEVSVDLASLKVPDNASISPDSLELSEAIQLHKLTILQPYIVSLKGLGRDECPGSLLFGEAAISAALGRLVSVHQQTYRPRPETFQFPGLSMDIVLDTKQQAAIGVKSGDDCHLEIGSENDLPNCSTKCVGFWSSQEAIELSARLLVAVRLRRHDLQMRLSSICKFSPDCNMSLVLACLLDVRVRRSMKKLLCGVCMVEVGGGHKELNPWKEWSLRSELQRIFNCSKAFEGIQDHKTAQKYLGHLIQASEREENIDFVSLSEKKRIILLRIESEATLGAICARQRHFEEATNHFFGALWTYVAELELTQQDVLDSFPQIDSRITEVYSQLKLHGGRYWMPLEAGLLHLRQIHTVSHTRHNTTVQMSLGLRIVHEYCGLGDDQSADETCRKIFSGVLAADYTRDTPVAMALLTMGLNVGRECLAQNFPKLAWHIYEQLLPEFLKGNCEYDGPESEALLSYFIDLADEFSSNGFRDVAEYIYMALAPVLIKAEDYSVVLEIADIFTSADFLVSAEHLLKELLPHIIYCEGSLALRGVKTRQKLFVVLRRQNKATESAKQLLQSYYETKQSALMDKTQLRIAFEKDVMVAISLLIAKPAALDAMVTANEGPETNDELARRLSRILEGFAIEEQTDSIDDSHGKRIEPINPSTQRISGKKSGRGSSSVITQLTSSSNAKTSSTVESHLFGTTYSEDSATAWFR